MSNSDHYKVTPNTSDNEKVRYYFRSIGKGNIFKGVEYSIYDKVFEGKPIYNLGFGNYDVENEKIISDTSLDNNGDVYKVFNTVLSTVPLFFKEIPSGIIHVQGSDDNPVYFDICRATCKKKCTDKCKNGGRRMALYRNFINKNYFTLSIDYVFGGGIEDNGDTLVENYEPGKFYDTILVYKKNKLI